MVPLSPWLMQRQGARRGPMPTMTPAGRHREGRESGRSEWYARQARPATGRFPSGDSRHPRPGAGDLRVGGGARRSAHRLWTPRAVRYRASLCQEIPDRVLRMLREGGSRLDFGQGLIAAVATSRWLRPIRSEALAAPGPRPVVMAATNRGADAVDVHP